MATTFRTPWHGSRRIAIDGCPVADLSELVLAPCAHGAVLEQRQRMHVARTDRDHVGEARNAHGVRHEILDARRPAPVVDRSAAGRCRADRRRRGPRRRRRHRARARARARLSRTRPPRRTSLRPAAACSSACVAALVSRTHRAASCQGRRIPRHPTRAPDRWREPHRQAAEPTTAVTTPVRFGIGYSVKGSTGWLCPRPSTSSAGMGSPVAPFADHDFNGCSSELCKNFYEAACHITAQWIGLMADAVPPRWNNSPAW